MPRKALVSCLTAAACLVPLAAAAPALGATPFQSPSGNIGCYIERSWVRCDIRERSWRPPPKPARCDLDWAQGVFVGRRGRARFTCAGDTTLGNGRRLAYGRSISRGRITCVSRRRAMRCVNRRTGHGFALSRQSARLFARTRT